MFAGACKACRARFWSSGFLSTDKSEIPLNLHSILEELHVFSMLCLQSTVNALQFYINKGLLEQHELLE